MQHHAHSGGKHWRSNKQRKKISGLIEEKLVTYPICAWSHSPWGRSNTRGTWLVTADATVPNKTFSQHTCILTLQLASCVLLNVCLKEKKGSRMGGRDDFGQMPALSATDTNEPCDSKAAPPPPPAPHPPSSHNSPSVLLEGRTTNRRRRISLRCFS